MEAPPNKAMQRTRLRRAADRQSGRLHAGHGQEFYEKLGEDVANELVEWFNQVDATYRSDLRELNELNFARFDAKLEQRVAELRREIGVGLGELKAEFHKELGTAKADLIKWMFVFWAPAVLALIGLYFKG